MRVCSCLFCLSRIPNSSDPSDFAEGDTEENAEREAGSDRDEGADTPKRGMQFSFWAAPGTNDVCGPLGACRGARAVAVLVSSATTPHFKRQLWSYWWLGGAGGCMQWRVCTYGYLVREEFSLMQSFSHSFTWCLF